MASMNNPMDCGVCQEEFNEDSKCPRTLPCSHHFCGDCINKLISQDSMMCPLCRKPFVANSDKDVMVNHALVDCMKYMTLQKSTRSTTSLKTSSAYHQKIVEFKEVASEGNSEALHNIQELKKQAEKMIESATEVRDCQGRLLPHILKIISEFNLNAQRLEPATKNLKDYIAAVEEKEKLLNIAKSQLDSANSFQAAAAIMDETEETSVLVNEWAESLEGSLADIEGLIQSTKKEQILSEKLNEDIMKAHECDGEEVEGATSKKQELPNNLSSFDLWRMTRPVKHLIERGRLFARQDKKIAKITIENNKLHLYSLEPENPEAEDIPNRCYITYEDVMTLVDTDVPVFLDVCVQESVKGRIHILLNDEAPATLPIHLTAGNGHSYINVSCKALDKGSLLELLLLGGPKSRQCTMGDIKAFSMKQYQGALKSASGSVELLDVNATPPLFAIRTGPYTMKPYSGYSNTRDQKVIGYVTDGLSILHEASHCVEDIEDVKISCCGVVLSTEVAIKEK